MPEYWPEMNQAKLIQVLGFMSITPTLHYSRSLEGVGATENLLTPTGLRKYGGG
jgi:hypothetical protein